MKVVKNKMAPPFREVEFDILYGQGISRAGDLVDLATELNLVEKSGAWFSYGGERIGQGRENAKTYMEQHPELMEKLEGMILQKHGIMRAGAASASASVAAAPAPASTNGTAHEEKGATRAQPAPAGQPAN